MSDTWSVTPSTTLVSPVIGHHHRINCRRVPLPCTSSPSVKMYPLISLNLFRRILWTTTRLRTSYSPQLCLFPPRPLTKVRQPRLTHFRCSLFIPLPFFVLSSPSSSCLVFPGMHGSSHTLDEREYR